MPARADQAVSLPDGRHICPACARTAVCDPALAQSLFSQVVAILTTQLGLALRVGADFTLADAQHLSRLARETPLHPAQDPERIVGLFVRKGRHRTMYVLYGLPQVLFIQTVAHEWAHAWHGENCPLLEDPMLREGFSEWVAYRVLQALGAVREAARMTRQDGIYGEGLRWMLRLEAERGPAGVLEACRRGMDGKLGNWYIGNW